MSQVEKAVRSLVACCGLLITLCLPVLSETPIPDREKLHVGALDRQSIIPTAANNPGRFGAHYKTRVVIFNPTSRDFSITARLYDSTGLVGLEEIRMDEGNYQVWDNFLGDVFNHTGGGGIWLRAPEEEDRFYVTAEVYTDSPNGRFSTTVVNGIYPVYSEGYDDNYNVGISVGAIRRTNIGVLNWDTEPSFIEANVFDGEGTLVQTVEFELEPEAWQQKTIRASVENGFVRWEILGESAAHYFYAVEVDNDSNDGTLSWSVKP